MNWISEVFKHVTVSRSLIFAVFVTSAALIFGQEYFPNIIKPLPDLWAIGMSGALIFSGVLLLWWIVPAIWNIAFRSCKGLANFIRSRVLDDLEKSLLLTLGELADESLDLRRINYSDINHSKLEILDATRRLKSKGLVDTNFLEENLVYLTALGRAQALKLQRRKNESEKA